MTLTQKLHPSRFSAMSGKMAAIVGYILGKRWTSPAIIELIVTDDGHLLATHEGDCGCNDYLGWALELESNWNRLLDVARLTPAERKEADAVFERAVMTPT